MSHAEDGKARHVSGDKLPSSQRPLGNDVLVPNTTSQKSTSMSNSPFNPPTKIKVLSGRVVHELELPEKVHKTKSRRIREPPKVADSTSLSQPAMSSQSIDEIEPLYIGSTRDLEEVFRDMSPHFEGKESEQNWSRREKSVLKLRRITKGNSPRDFVVAYLAGIRSLLDGILKTVNSLRTTVSTNGCHLVQEMAKASGTGLDSMVEILLQSLIKLCANTKKITAANGDVTVNAVVAHVTYNVRLAQHIWYACQDKNVQPRTYATGWLKTIIMKHRHHKHALEHAGSLDLIEKCIKLGLADRDPKVRESMRPTFWAFARLWSERSEG
jgi:CLIP-associating protein 1/2